MTPPEHSKKPRLEQYPPEPSTISRNYSGTTAIYTPPYVAKAIIQLVERELRDLMNLPISDPEITWWDPAFGDGIFLKALIEYFFLKKKKEKIPSFLKNQFFGTEIDSNQVKIVKTSLAEWFNAKQIKFSQNEIPVYHFDSLKPPTISNHQSIRELKTETENPKAPLIIIGNPPYAISSKNKNSWISQQIEEYKTNLNREGKKRVVGLKGIQDDYVKFLRMAHWKLQSTNRPGIIAFIVNNYFLEGDIFRGLRYSWLRDFSVIKIINLHGDPKKNLSSHRNKYHLRGLSSSEQDVAAQKDENIFDIQTGVCIVIASYLPLNQRSLSGTISEINQSECNPHVSFKSLNSEEYLLDKGVSLALEKIFSKEEFPNGIAKVQYCDLFGSKSLKETILSTHALDPTIFHEVPLRLDFQFIPMDKKSIFSEYQFNQFYYIPSIFKNHIIGVQSLHDTLITHPDRERLIQIMQNFYDRSDMEYKTIDSKKQIWVKRDGVEYHDARDWKIEDGFKGSLDHAIKSIIQWNWRGFDKWWVSYDKNLMTRGSSSFKLCQYLLPQIDNMAIGMARSSRKAQGNNSILMSKIAESHFIEGGTGIGDYLFPLKIGENLRNRNWDHPDIPSKYNFNIDFLKAYTKYYNLSLLPEKQLNSIESETLFYFLYGILWTPDYRERYKEYLKLDFPHINFPSSYTKLEEMAILGRKLANTHMQDTYEESELAASNIQFHFATPCRVGKYHYNKSTETIHFQLSEDLKKKENSWIQGVSEQEWEFEIGGQRQLWSWLRSRIFRNTSSIKYAFKRPLHPEEQRYFLSMILKIRKTTNILNPLSLCYKSWN